MNRQMAPPKTPSAASAPMMAKTFVSRLGAFPVAQGSFVELKSEQREHHFFGGLVALPRPRAAGLENDLVQEEQVPGFRATAREFRQCRILIPVLARADFVEDFSEGVNVRADGARAFGGEEAIGADKRPALRGVRHQPDVREFRHAVHER